MRLATLTFLAAALNGAIDSGRFDTLAIEDVRKAIQAGTIFPYLKRTLGSDIDLSIFDADAAAEAELLAGWQDMDNAIDARRKCGIEHRGLPLLVAFLLEGIQCRARNGA